MKKQRDLAPGFMKEKWQYLDSETETWKLKPDAPAWAKKEFEEYYKKPVPDKNGRIRIY